jgi:hypothetical protein
MFHKVTILIQRLLKNEAIYGVTQRLAFLRKIAELSYSLVFWAILLTLKILMIKKDIRILNFTATLEK